jgi:anti-sigma factor RsiW
MDCNECPKNISILIDGELGQQTTQALRQHLVACSTCRNTYERVAALNESLRSVSLNDPPSMLAARVKARLLRSDARNVSPDRPLRHVWGRVPLLAMIALLAIGLGNVAGRSMTEMLFSHSQEPKLEYLLTDAGQSLFDILMEIGVEENSR